MDTNMPGACPTFSIEDASLNENNFNVYPNPFSSSFQLDFHLNENAHLEIELVNYLGQTIKKIADRNFTTGENKIEVDLLGNDIKAGIYILKIDLYDSVIYKKVVAN